MGFVADAPTTGRFVPDAVAAAGDTPLFPRVVSAAAPKGETGTFGQYVGQEAVKGVMDTPTMILKGLAEASGPGAVLRLLPYAYKALGMPEGSGERIPNFSDLVDRARKGYEELIGVTNLKPADTAQKLLGAGARFAGASVVPSAVTVAKAARPLTALSAEAMASIEGGAAASVGGDVGADIGKRVGGPTGETIGRAAGDIIGGVAGSITGAATPIALDKLRAVVAPNFSKNALGASANALAAKELGGALNVNPSTQANLAQAESVKDALAKLGAGEFKPTLAQASGAPAIASLEHNVARSMPEELGKYSQVHAQNEQVIRAATEMAFPGGGNISRAVDVSLRKTSSALDDLLSRIETTRENLAAALPGAAQQFSGEKLQILRDQAQKVARAEKNSRIKDLYSMAKRAGVKENLVGEAELLKKLRDADVNEFQKMPPLFGEVIRKYMPGDKVPVFVNYSSFEELHSLYRATNSQLISANRAGNRTQEYFLMQLKNSLGERLAAFETKGQGDVAAKLTEFNQWFSTKYAPAFYEGVGGRMAAINRFGEIVKPETVVSKFFTPSGIDDFNLLYQGNAEAQRALSDGVIGLFKDAAIREGYIDQGAAQRFMRANKETLDKLPDISGALKTTTAINDALAARAGRLSEAQSALDKTTLAKIANEPDNAKVAQKALADPGYLRQLIASSRDERTRKATARAIVYAVPEAAQKAGMDPLAFVLSNEAALRPALDKLDLKHFENLLTIATAKTIQRRATPPLHGEPLSITGMAENITGSSPRTIWAQSANTAAGRQSAVTAALHLLSRFLIKKTEDRTDDLLKAVIYDPALAAEMAKASKMPFNIAESNRLSEHLINAGIRVSVFASSSQGNQ